MLSVLLRKAFGGASKLLSSGFHLGLLSSPEHVVFAFRSLPSLPLLSVFAYIQTCFSLLGCFRDMLTLQVLNWLSSPPHLEKLPPAVFLSLANGTALHVLSQVRTGESAWTPPSFLNDCLMVSAKYLLRSCFLEYSQIYLSKMLVMSLFYLNHFRVITGL